MVEIKESIETINEQLAIAKGKIQLHLAKRSLEVIESTLTYSPRRGIYGRNNISAAEQYQDRTRSIRTTAELFSAQNSGQLLAENHPNAGGTLFALRRHVIGNGSCFEIISTDDEGDPPVQLAKKFKKLIRVFNEANNWCEIEKDMLMRLHMHGEFFLEVWPDEATMEDSPFINPTKVVFVEPQFIQSPLKSDSDGDWSWGILTNGSDPTPMGYNVRDFKTQRDRFVPASLMIHVKINCLINAKRGIPTLYLCDGDLKRVALARKAGGEGTAIRHNIAYMRIFDDRVSASNISALSSAEATDFAVPLGDTGDTVEAMKLDGPSIVNTRSVSIQGPPPNPDSSGVGNTIDQGLQAVAAVFGVPEWVPSGKADVSSYAGSLQAGSPFIQTIQETQAVISKATIMTYRVVAGIAIEQGVIGENSLEICDFKVTFPDAAVKNKQEEATIQFDLWDRGMIDTDSVLAKQGYDPEEVAAKLENDPSVANRTVPPKIQLSQTPAAQYSRQVN